MTCNCNGNTDIRGRCNPHFYKEEWKTCPMRADTMYEMMWMEGDIGEKINEKRTIKGLKGYIKKTMKIYKITDEDWEQMLQLEKEAREETETEEEKERRLKKEKQNEKKREYNKKRREEELQALRTFADFANSIPKRS